jgi:hypothetical protein
LVVVVAPVCCIDMFVSSDGSTCVDSWAIDGSLSVGDLLCCSKSAAVNAPTDGSARPSLPRANGPGHPSNSTFSSLPLHVPADLPLYTRSAVDFAALDDLVEIVAVP